MSDKVLNVQVVDRQEVLWSGQARQTSIPAVDGRLGILPGRQPLLAILTSGTVNIDDTAGTVIKYQVNGGFASVDDDFVTVVVEEAHLAS